MKSCARHDAARCGHSRLATRIAATAILLVLALPAHAWVHGRPAGPHPAMRARAHRMGGSFQRQQPPREPQREPERNQERSPEQHPSTRSQQNHGGEHLPEWYRTHQHMTLQEQERALRRQPGFNKLSPTQRRRLLQRLRYLDSQPPAVRARIMARNEAFEHLSPERRQEVRAAAQAFQHMPRVRKQQLSRAFHILRTLPPDERAAILHSARFRNEYSPRERHILSNLLSIEPWQPPPPRRGSAVNSRAIYAPASTPARPPLPCPASARPQSPGSPCS